MQYQNKKNRKKLRCFIYDADNQKINFQNFLQNLFLIVVFKRNDKNKHKIIIFTDYK